MAKSLHSNTVVLNGFEQKLFCFCLAWTTNMK